MKYLTVLLVILGVVGLVFKSEIRAMREIKSIQAEFDKDTIGLRTVATRFKLTSGKEVMDFVKVEHPLTTVSGACDRSRQLILINFDIWPQMSSLEHKELIYHELGHCSLGLWHYDLFEDLMNWVAPIIKESQWTEYKSKFFTRAKVEQMDYIGEMHGIH